MAATKKTTKRAPAKKTATKKVTTKAPAKKASARKTTSRVASTVPPPSPSKLQLTHGAPVGVPIFAQATVTPDPMKYKTPHASDSNAYSEMDALVKANKFLPLPFPVVPNVIEPVLLLQDSLGPTGAASVASLQKAGQIVFHTAGDTGATRGPQTENEVVDKMLADFNESDPTAAPSFFFNLGDIVYSFGEHKYYYDQFYDAYRDYPAPIFAIPGNHDGIVLPPPAGTGVASDSLSAFLANFCTSAFSHAPDAVGLSRTTMIQPGVYFTLDAPFVRIIGLYSNILENPGVISSTPDPTKAGAATFPDLSDAQIAFLTAALTRVKTEGFQGAVLLAVHHPPYAFGKHSGSVTMLKEIDAVCESTGVWPHAVLSGHAHNYQRYTRAIGNRQIPYLVIGNGGHGLQKLAIGDGYRTPVSMPVFAQPERNDSVTFENYDFTNYGYCRVLVNAKQLRIEYHPASDGASTKTPDDSVTVDLVSGTITTYVPPS